MGYIGAAHQELIDDSLDRLFRYYDGTANRWLTYDGQSLIAEWNAAGTVIARRYVHGPGTDEPLVWYDLAGSGERHWLHADERGSIVATSDSSGAMLAINSYDEYGIPGASNSGRFQYTGQAWLSEIGMYYYRARIDSPSLGRFMQTDPIGFGGGMNLYAYVRGDPVNLTDPLGLDPPIVVTGRRHPRPTEPGTMSFGAGDGGTGGGNPSSLADLFQLPAPVEATDESCDPENCATVTGSRPKKQPARRKDMPTDYEAANHVSPS